MSWCTASGSFWLPRPFSHEGLIPGHSYRKEFSRGGRGAMCHERSLRAGPAEDAEYCFPGRAARTGAPLLSIHDPQKGFDGSAERSMHRAPRPPRTLLPEAVFRRDSPRSPRETTLREEPTEADHVPRACPLSGRDLSPPSDVRPPSTPHTGNRSRCHHSAYVCRRLWRASCLAGP